MPRFRRTTRRRFRRTNPKRLLRKGSRLKKIAFRKIRNKQNRKDRKRRHNKYGYVYTSFNAATKGHTGIWDVASNNTQQGLGSSTDIDTCFKQVRQIEDFLFAGQNPTTPQLKANRHNLNIRISAKATYTITNVNSAGGSFVQVYICRPKHDIAADGLGVSGDTQPGSLVLNNLNSTLSVDYNNAASLGITGGQIDNAYSQTKPSASSGDHWITPFMVPEFTKNYKVVKVLKTFIPAGGSFMFGLKLGLTRINYQEFQRGGTTTVQWLKKFSKLVFIRHHGQPNNDDTTSTLINYDESNLCALVSKTYEFSYGHQAQYFTFRGTDSTGTLTNTTFPGNAEEKVEEAAGGA